MILTTACHVILVFLDNEKPYVSCPKEIDTSTDIGKGTADISALLNISDNSGYVDVSGNTTYGFEFPIGKTVVSFVARDPSGNNDSCVLTVIVRDGETPEIICPENITKDTDPGEPTAILMWPLPDATDNSGRVHVTSTHQWGSDFNIGITVVTYTVSDPSGNIAECFFIVTVTDNENPILKCPNNIEASTDHRKPTRLVDFPLPNAADNSGHVTLNGSHIPGSRFPIGTDVVSFVARDPYGNTQTCKFNITVIDDEKPTMICPESIVTFADPGKTTSVANWPIPTASDNSGGVVKLNNSHDPGILFPLGKTVIFYTATDQFGNAYTCNFTVTVIGDETVIQFAVGKPYVTDDCLTWMAMKLHSM
ncbi:hyalin-like [Ptychodera flava]|uniref:hyalin-like n=1 Tax=Ptychodera flava TaxID=63121 RepID=UPI00396A3962